MLTTNEYNQLSTTEKNTYKTLQSQVSVLAGNIEALKLKIISLKSSLSEAKKQKLDKETLRNQLLLEKDRLQNEYNNAILKKQTQMMEELKLLQDVEALKKLQEAKLAEEAKKLEEARLAEEKLKAQETMPVLDTTPAQIIQSSPKPVEEKKSNAGLILGATALGIAAYLYTQE